MRYLTLTLVFFISFFSKGQTPTVAASNIVFTFTGCNEVDISWTNGNGNNRVVFVREGSSVSNVPEYNEYYTDNPIFGNGEDIKGDKTNYCVYRGPGSSVKIKGLKKLTKYCIAVFEYNGGGGVYDYKTDAYPTNCITTKNIVADGYIQDIMLNSQTGQCLYDNSFQFKNRSNCDITPFTYSWKFGDGDTSNLEEPKHTYKIAGIMKVNIIIRAKGCYAFYIFNDTVHPNPVAKFEFGPEDTLQCWYGNQLTFINHSTLVDIGSGVSSIRYEWYEDLNWQPFSTSYKATCKFKTVGKKMVKLVAINNRGCRDSMVRGGYTIKPRAIDPSKTIINPYSMPLKNNTFKFTNTDTKTWQIRSKNNPAFKDSIRGKVANYSFTAVGRYYISFDTIDTKTGCYDKYTDSVEVTKDLGKLSSSVLETISIYPNPSKSGIFQINNLPVNATIKMYDIIGKELLNLNPKHTNAEINLSHFGAGTYILSLWSEGRKLDYRLMVL